MYTSHYSTLSQSLCCVHRSHYGTLSVTVLCTHVSLWYTYQSLCYVHMSHYGTLISHCVMYTCLTMVHSLVIVLCTRLTRVTVLCTRLTTVHSSVIVLCTHVSLGFMCQHAECRHQQPMLASYTPKRLIPCYSS